MARQHVWERELNSVEQADMNEVRELMGIVNQDPPFTDEAKETFRVAVIGSGAAYAMKQKFILTDEERTGLLIALRNLVGSLKVN
jgi:hypothetical protein